MLYISTKIIRGRKHDSDFEDCWVRQKLTGNGNPKTEATIDPTMPISGSDNQKRGGTQYEKQALKGIGPADSN